jgi:NDP-sugar pyrophosphorylase family protein
MKAMIQAARQGTRLRPLTLDRPKSMLPAAGRPMLEYTVAWLRYHGITQIANRLYPSVPRSWWTTSAMDALTGSRSRTHSGTFALLCGDVLTDLDLEALTQFDPSGPAGPRLSVSP